MKRGVCNLRSNAKFRVNVQRTDRAYPPGYAGAAIFVRKGGRWESGNTETEGEPENEDECDG